VVVVAPRVSARNIAHGGDLTDVILSGLLATGFTLLTEPDTTLEQAPGRVHVTFDTGQRITVTDADGTTLYDGTLPVPDGWAELVQYTGLLGVVVVRGLDLLDPDRDHIADLHAAIGRGTAVGIAVQVDPRPRPEPTQPALPPPTQPALPAANRTRRRS
jgi:beta-lactamase superfamily II metal-dependent hydrolase